ncbi:hypothetical protein E2C01_082651 [Portunus trituberculatus]|uniref:Uncharacterized protein n=1 Tax=Portunus trituberculatus TaxID=210409 RepID=A0A5B7J4C7_PORTR|nr:hypothetical protein [Portunus trituberculatus]
MRIRRIKDETGRQQQPARYTGINSSSRDDPATQWPICSLLSLDLTLASHSLLELTALYLRRVHTCQYADEYTSDNSPASRNTFPHSGCEASAG